MGRIYIGGSLVDCPYRDGSDWAAECSVVCEIWGDGGQGGRGGGWFLVP